MSEKEREEVNVKKRDIFKQINTGTDLANSVTFGQIRDKPLSLTEVVALMGTRPPTNS